MGSANERRFTCEMVGERLEEYCLGTLPEGEERTLISAHLADCQDCQALVSFYDHSQNAWESFSKLPIPERRGDWQAVRMRLNAPGEKPRSRPVVPVFGGKYVLGLMAAITVGMGAVLFPMPQHVEETQGTKDTHRITGADIWPTERNGGLTKTPVKKVQTTNERNSGLLGRVTVGNAGRTLTVAPASPDFPASDAYPVIVEVENPGDAVEAELSARSDNDGQARLRHYQIHLNARGKSRFMIYPAIQYSMREESDRDLHITLTAPNRRQELNLNTGAVFGYNVVAYVGKRMGLLYAHGNSDGKKSPDFQKTYITPQNAPDRAIGWNCVSMIVLSPEAVTMNAAQWEAIQKWVAAGGKLVMTSPELLNSVGGATLAPVEPSRDNKDKGVRGRADATFVPDIVWDAPIYSTQNGTTSNTTADVYWRRCGLGSVLYTTFDPVSDELRAWGGFAYLWDRIRHLGPSLPATSNIRTLAHDTRPGSSDRPQDKQDDPFLIGFPSVINVVYFFLVYFVMVVPVTFVVLKHTRRLNLVWISGPALAMLFASGLFLLTIRLYLLQPGHRTAGALLLANGAKTGRFAGSTELFFPRAGRYTLPMVAGELLESRPTSLNDSRMPEEKLRPLTSVENLANYTQSAVFEVPNLSYRRLHHEGEVTIAGAITGELRQDAQGQLIGEIRNDTGQTLHDVVLSQNVRIKQSDTTYRQYLDDVVEYNIGEIPPGTYTVANLKKVTNPQSEKRPYLYWLLGGNYTPGSNLKDSLPAQMTLAGKMSGAHFGPQTGRDFSDDQSVTFLVNMNMQTNGGQK